MKCTTKRPEWQKSRSARFCRIYLHPRPIKDQKKDNMNKYLPAAKAINIHGFRGTIKAESLCDTPMILASLPYLYLDGEQEAFKPMRVQKGAVSGRFVLLTLEGIDSEEKANALRGRFLYADRADLPLKEGQAFLCDMLGLDVIDSASGKVYGRLTDVEEGVASRLYVIKTPRGEVRLPESGPFIDRIDTESGIYVTPIPGLFDDDGETV